MAKSLLKDFKIGGDIIDRVAEPAPVVLPFRSVETPVSALPPPVGAAGEKAESPTSEKREELEEDSAPNSTSALGFTHIKDGLFHIFTIGETTYRVGGVKALFVTSLRVNIKVSHGERSDYDGLDLYVAKARAAFARTVSASCGVEPGRVEKDLVMILETLELERDEALRSAGTKAPVELTGEEKELGLGLLRDPNLFERICADLSALGYVGEDLNKQLMYLCASSRKLDDPMSVLILSQSASGKSFLVDCVKKLMPPDEVVAVTSLSDQALNYIDDLMHKFLVLGEAVHGEVVEHQIREMLSGKELSRLVTVKDAETGKMQSRVMRTPVVVASVMSGTNHAINPENASRCFVVNTDESRGQTARIHEHQRHKYSRARLAGGSADTALVIKTHQAAQRLLTKRRIVNDFAPHLNFPTTLMRLRRDHDRFLDLIAAVCYLRQYQKTPQKMDGVEFITCDLEDYRVAYAIMVGGVLGSTMREMGRGASVLYEELRTLARSEAKKKNLEVTEVSLTQRQIREASGLGQTWVREHLRQLVDLEYITLVRGGNERAKGFYRLKEDAELASVDLSMIPTPEAMAVKLRTN